MNIKYQILFYHYFLCLYRYFLKKFPVAHNFYFLSKNIAKSEADIVENNYILRRSRLGMMQKVGYFLKPYYLTSRNYRILKHFVVQPCADIHPRGEQSHRDKQGIVRFEVSECSVFALYFFNSIISGFHRSSSLYFFMRQLYHRSSF